MYSATVEQRWHWEQGFAVSATLSNVSAKYRFGAHITREKVSDFVQNFYWVMQTS